MFLRPAIQQDHAALATFLQTARFTHRHLDWRYSLDWLGCPPFWVAFESSAPSNILAALACPADLPHHTWIRFFAAANQAVLSSTFSNLLQAAAAELAQDMTLGAVGLNSWMSELLLSNQFHLHQRIVILEWDNHFPPARKLPAGARIRRMEPGDLDAVLQIDNLAFETLWQNSRDEILRSLHQSSYATVVELEGNLLGYQISTCTFLSAHLARLAVHPQSQRHSIGRALVEDLQYHFKEMGVDRLTVNTQHNNQASLTLYQSMGFALTGEAFPVFIKVIKSESG